MRGKGGRGVGIQKGRRASREERPMILTSKRQKTSEIELEQKNVCNLISSYFVLNVHRTTYKRIN